MSTPLLPRLNEENKIAITKRGEWISDTQNTLKNLVTDLKVTTDFKSNITSIPDLWARPAMYEMVLFDEKHHLHQQYVAQWRGILAMLAFREMRNLKNIKREEIIVPENSQLTADAPDFLKVLAGLLPEEYKEFPDNTVESGYKIQLLTYTERPLAIIWPTILVCPAVGLDKITSSLSWWGNYGINDPVSSLNDQEKVLLLKWLDGIKEALPTNAKCNKLIKLISEFQKDLDSKEKPNNYGLGTGLNITGFCRLIDKPIRCSIDEKQFLEASNVMLINRRNQAAKKLLVMTTDMHKQWNRAASDIIVAGNINLDAALPFGGYLPNKNKLNDIDLSQYHAELRMGEDFFTEKICLIASEIKLFPNAFDKSTGPLNYNGAFYNFVLPVKRELLDYVSPEYLVKNFRISSLEGKIKVEMDLPLKGFDESGTTLTISKIYEAGDTSDELKCGIIDWLAAPAIQLWPNFIPNNSETWQAYYSFYDNKAVKSFYAKPLWKAEECESRRLNFASVQAEICRGREFPEGFVCTYNIETFSGSKEIELGLILLKMPKKLELAVNNPCKIGVDFGTTNSVMYMTMHDNTRMIQLKNRLYPVTEIDILTNAELRRHFFTASEQPNGDSISIRTLFNPNDGAFSGDLNQAVFPGVVYYLDGIDNTDKDQNVTRLIQGKNMKWDSAQTAASAIGYTKYFLYQIALQCMAEAVVAGATEIEWYYSYPKSFSKTQITKLKGIWGAVMDFCRTVSPNICTKEPEAKTESAAMAGFFKGKMGASFQRGMVCFDIGGGSTDIAIWQGSNSDKPVGQCSLIFAGQDILNKQLYKNRQTILQLKNNNEEFNKFIQKLHDISDGDYNKFSMELEALLKYQQNSILDSMVAKSENRDVKLFLRNIAFAISGIFYYAGGLVGESFDFSNGVQLPHCYVGGNASKLLDWVDQGKYTVNRTFESVYTTCLVAGAATKTKLSSSQVRFKVNQSTNPKEEVAYGLVADKKTIVKTESDATTTDVYDPFAMDAIGTVVKPEDQDRLLAGESFWCNGEKKTDACITLKDVSAGVIVDADLPNFRRFLMGFNALMAREGFTGEYQIQFSEEDLDEIKDQTNELLDEQSRMEASEINLEPPFITILKQALNLLSK